jgi:hypothetical protein
VAKQHQKQQREKDKTHKDAAKKMKSTHAKEVKKMQKVVHLIYVYFVLYQW